MKIKTWFGEIEPETGETTTTSRDPEVLAERLLEQTHENREEIKEEIDLRKLAETAGIKEDYNHLLHQTLLGLAKMQLEKVEWDEEVIQAVETLDGIGRAVNLLTSHLREWQSLYPSPPTQLKTLEEDIKRLQETRKEIEKRITEKMQENSPRLSQTAGAVLAARLLRIAGNSQRLASMPASTIQILGAEKALFRHLKGKAPSPKHGIIYQHPEIHRSPPEERGRKARKLACKIALASRIDHYRKNS